MSQKCPTCGAEMRTIGEIGVWRYCDRCGTFTTEFRDVLYVPRLVERCREFGATGLPDWAQGYSGKWDAIAECLGEQSNG